MLPYDPIGLDLSLTSTGVAVGDETFAISATGLTGPARLQHVRSEFHNYLANRLHDTQKKPLIVVEGYSFASRNSHAHALGELGGVIRLWLYDHGFAYVDVPPTVRAKFATGRGNAGKSEVVSAVSARTGIVWSGSGGDDRCDAWILQEMALTHYGHGRFNWPDSHTAVLDKIQWP